MSDNFDAIVGTEFDPPAFVPLSKLGVAGTGGAYMMEQGSDSPAWLGIRRGLITASNVSAVVTPTGKQTKGATRETYMYRLVAERLIGETAPTYVSAAMQRGIDLEPHARAWYEMATGRDVVRAGFAKRNAFDAWGCSPDGLCADRMIEIKCPEQIAFVRAMDQGVYTTAAVLQCQFQMWCTGMDRCDLVMYWPQDMSWCRVEPFIIEYERNADLHAAFDEYIPAFAAEVDEVVQRLTKEDGE